MGPSLSCPIGYSKYGEGQDRNVSSETLQTWILEQQAWQGRAKSSANSKHSDPNTVT